MEDEDLFRAAREAKLSKPRLAPSLEELRHWISTTYGINVLHIDYDKVELGPHKSTPRLTVVLETEDEHEQMFEEPFSIKPNIEKAILEQFSRIVVSHSATTEFNTVNVLLILDEFSSEAIGKTLEQFDKKHTQAVIGEFSESIWDLNVASNSVVIFYHTDKDVERNAQSGISERIRARCWELAKQYDEFNYLDPQTFPIVFDSKENLDANYQGNRFFYFR